jgi:cellulose synthase (UDP-forming)
MFYCRTAPSRDADNAMFACGSGVVWRLSAVESVGGFDTWNLVEDLTTSYKLLSSGWQSRYHFEALSRGLAPEDLPNFIKQRGTWAIDTLRLFFWKNPLWQQTLTWRQKLHFLETPLFYLNGITTLLLILSGAAGLLFEAWPTTASAWEHARFGLPTFLTMEFYFLLLSDRVPFHRVRQFWVGLAPVFTVATIKALVYGPYTKPKYVVTRKNNQYDNYLHLVLPQVLLLGLLLAALLKTVIATPLYSGFDWYAVFWCLYFASYFLQIIRVAWWKWQPIFKVTNSLERFKFDRRRLATAVTN